jgi:hypothetical protein
MTILTGSQPVSGVLELRLCGTYKVNPLRHKAQNGNKKTAREGARHTGTASLRGATKRDPMVPKGVRRLGRAEGLCKCVSEDGMRNECVKKPINEVGLDRLTCSGTILSATAMDHRHHTLKDIIQNRGKSSACPPESSGGGG